MAREWLKNAVFYEVYPQSFYSPERSAPGTLKGITQKLDYIKALGCNAVWLNPIFDSPFKDAGYDVRDYKKTASRYGTNDDAAELFKKAHEKGLHIILDLVPGHTSEEHIWFKQSSSDKPNEMWGRYIWTDSWFKGISGRPYIGGETPRNGTYMLNFFKCQPALNYGWLDPKESWQSAIDSDEALKTRDAMKDIMRFWLRLGCDGFRVDMADSLVKGDEEKHATAAVWKDMIGAVREDFPEAVFVSEWSNPYISLCEAGFDMDFYLDHPGNGYNFLLRDYEAEKEDRSYFRSDSHVSCSRFINEYLPMYEFTRNAGYISFITGNHDTVRISRNLDERERKVAMAFLLTLPGVPFIYYGDEIGMRYLDLPSHEGGYTRTGSRTPMQWDDAVVKAGLNGKLYLPCDDASDAPTVLKCAGRPDSLYNTVKSLLDLRSKEASLKADSGFYVIFLKDDSPLFVYGRGDLVLAVNPSSSECKAYCDLPPMIPVWTIGEGRADGNVLHMTPQSFAVFRRRS